MKWVGRVGILTEIRGEDSDNEMGWESGDSD